jgi:hypothetical protein
LQFQLMKFDLDQTSDLTQMLLAYSGATRY